MLSTILKLYYAPGAEPHAIPLTEYLALTNYDELLEIDLPNGRYTPLCHVEGKYFVPVTDNSLRSIFRFGGTHMVHPDDREIFENLLDPATLEQRVRNSETPGAIYAHFRCRLQSGGWRWTEQAVVGGPAAGLAPGQYRYYVYDIQSYKARETGEANEDYAHAFDRDETTGLLREKPFFYRAAALLKEHPYGWCLAAIDVEHFKLFNDWYGREAGDLLLSQMSTVLSQLEQTSGGIAGYMGLDDFCVMMPYDKPLLDQLYNDLRALVVQRDASVGFLPAVGVAPADGEEPIMDLFDRASIALRHAKGSFHRRVRLFLPSMAEQTEREYRILNEFQHALRNREIYFCLQPQCRVSTGKLVGAESLARWRTADGRMVPPTDFVPVLEKYGFITDLDKYVWEEVCAWLKRCQDRRLPTLPVSVNISPIDVLTLDVCDCLCELLRRYGVPIEKLKVEITESAYAGNAAVKSTVQKLRSRGFIVMMDDFGSGYSSLNMLSTVNIDIIKLDAQFLRMGDVARGESKGIHILESIVSLAKSLALPIVVEGVETIEQVEFLTGLGCSYAQGYYFYRPMPVEDYENLLRTPGMVDARGFVATLNKQFRIREFLDRNVYSDSMLNQVIGAVAIVSKEGEDVGILRYNEQFKRMVNAPEFVGTLPRLQRFLPEQEYSKLYDLLDRAERDRLNGASEALYFIKPDQSIARFLVRVYFIGEIGPVKRFYCSMQNVTLVSAMKDELLLLGRYAHVTLLVMRRLGNGWMYEVASNGLEHALGLSGEQVQRELNNGQLFQRMDADSRAAVIDAARHRAPGEAPAPDPVYANFHCGDGQIRRFRIQKHNVRGEVYNMDYIVIVTEAEK